MVQVLPQSILWSKEITSSLRELFALQPEITERVAAIVDAHVSTADLLELTRRLSAETSALDHYLRGNAAYFEGNRAANEAAIRFFEQAVEEDPNFALAWTGLARAYAFRSIKYFAGPEWIERALATADHALSLDPELPQAYHAKAVAEVSRSRSRQAREYVQRALELDPAYHSAGINLGLMQYESGEWDESLFNLLRHTFARSAYRPILAFRLWEMGFEDLGQALARELFREDPTRLDMGVPTAFQEILTGDYEAARARIEDLRRAHPDAPRLVMVAGELEWIAGDRDLALEHFQDLLFLTRNWESGTRDVELRLGILQGLCGDSEEANRLLEKVAASSQAEIDGGSEWHKDRWFLAAVAAARGRRERAIELYSAAVDLGHRAVYADRGHPIFAGLADDPRFMAQIERAQSEVESMKQRVRAEYGERLETTPGEFWAMTW